MASPGDHDAGHDPVHRAVRRLAHQPWQGAVRKIIQCVKGQKARSEFTLLKFSYCKLKVFLIVTPFLRLAYFYDPLLNENVIDIYENNL